MYRLDPIKQSRLVFLVLVMCAVVGPLSIDLFTPSLPAITEAFGTTSDMSQWTVSIFMLGFAISMLIVGPVSERFGSRRALLGGYTIYLLATVTILMTNSIEVFIAARLVQAVFGCFGTALSRSIARDIYKGKNDVRILGMIAATLVIAPMLAPAVGGMLQEAWGWHASFVLMIAVAMITMLAVCLLPGRDKTNPDASLNDLLSSFAVLFKDRRYMVPAMTSALAFSAAFAFVVAAPFVMIGTFDISPRDYGIMMGVVMGAYIIASANAGRITDWLGGKRTILLAWTVMIAGAVIGFASALLSGGQSAMGLVAGLVIYEIGLGLLLPSIQAKALAHLNTHTGTAAGMLFFLEMSVASGVSYIAGRMVLDNTLPLAGITLVLSLLALALSRLTCSSAETAPASA